MAVEEYYENLFYDDVESEENEESEDDEPQIHVDLHENPNDEHVMRVCEEDRRNEVNPITAIICLFIMFHNATLLILPIHRFLSHFS